jgi:RNA polymerase sigma factor (sigma-70 family)
MSDERVVEAPLMEILREAQAGDGRALDVLLVRLLPVARSWSEGRVKDEELRDLVDDIVQETAIRVVRHLGTCQATTPRELTSWVLSITHRESLRVLKRNWLRYRASLEYASAQRTVESSRDGKEAADRRIHDFLSEAHDRLPADAQTLLYLKIIEGSSWEEIGNTFGTTAGAAKRRYQRALARLKREVIGSLDGTGCPPALPAWLTKQS